MHAPEIFALFLGYWVYYTVIGGVTLYFLPTLLTIGYNGDYKGRVFLINLFGFLIFPWAIAIGLAFRKY